MSDNPFESPQPVIQKPGQSVEYQHDGSGRTFVRQISVVAWLMMAHGILMVFFALFSIGFYAFFSNIDNLIPPQQQDQLKQDFPDQQRTMIAGIYAVWGILSPILACIYIVAASLSLGYKARGFGITALFLGLGTLLTCYCAPTGIALSVYGLIIYFNPAVAEAFRLRKTGLSKQEVLARFVR